MRSSSTTSWRIRLVVGAALVGALAACSLIVDSSAEQCSSPADCARFPGTVCQQGFCVSESSLGDGGGDRDGSGSDDGQADDAAACVPQTSTPAELANDTCTNAECVSFDNCARLGICDGGLPALVLPPDGGVP